MHFLFEGVSLVFRDLFVFAHSVQLFVAVTTCIANANLGVLEGFFGLLNQLFTGFFGEGWDVEANDLSVVLWGDAEVGFDDGFFDIGQECCCRKL